ncbi:hypothetical protein [Vibrio sp. D173a]|uniref:hypothetical protein n=1 Tax=Vibrio sp. D173a TaxID=2836349 RepID=UPI0025568047|nr:hypothetical protein [Vibrio sp. D173a]
MLFNNHSIFGQFGFLSELRNKAYHIGKFSSSTIEPYKSAFTQSAVIVGNIKKLAEKTEEKIDFITDDQIISMYGNKVAQSSAIRNFTKGTVGLRTLREMTFLNLF